MMSQWPMWLQAGFWGAVAGSALLIGAVTAYFAPVPKRALSGTMSFGVGVLVSALTFKLMGKAYQEGGIDAAAIGFITGVTIFTVANFYLSYKGARYRKRSAPVQPAEEPEDRSGASTAVGSLLDSIPESIVIGLSMVGGGMSVVTVTAVFISNIPEALSSVTGMKEAGRPAWYIFGLWVFIALSSAVLSLEGYWLCRDLSPQAVAALTAMGAGAMLAMTADTMIPEALGEEQDFAGFITAIGFLVSFVLTSMTG